MNWKKNAFATFLEKNTWHQLLMIYKLDLSSSQSSKVMFLELNKNWRREILWILANLDTPKNKLSKWSKMFYVVKRPTFYLI